MKQTVALSMIVKNEAGVIRRCLESVKPLIDAWAIVDTGSTDETREIVRDVLAEIPGELHDEPQAKQSRLGRLIRPKQFDFARNRNVALEKARRFGCDYMLVIDADECVQLTDGARNEFPLLVHDRYVANFRQLPQNRIWHRTLLVKSNVPWYYKWPIHETLHCDDPGVTTAWIGGIEVPSYSDGGRNQDQVAKFRKDALACKAAIRAEPNEPRHWFYLGQSWAGANEFRKAVSAYERRIEMGGGWDEEVWYARFQIAALKQLLGYHWRDVQASYIEAFNARPWRSEPLWVAGCLARDNGEPAMGETLLRQACRITYPADSFLVDEAVYQWRAEDDLCGCLAMLGRKDECVALLKKLAEQKSVPDTERDRLVENIATAEAA